MNSTAGTSYSDSADIQDWARESIGVMSRYGIMNGVDDTHFDPKGTYTIEQSVVTLLRAFNTITDHGYLRLPAIPSGGKYYTVYCEGYRNGRIELAVYDTEENSKLVNDNGILSVSGCYTNDVKYYFCGGRWVQFESGYERISNNAQAVLWSSK
ncbi:MAG: S-layer homology domain-containing protein [Candidatus Ornithomonoglobus sp.]